MNNTNATTTLEGTNSQVSLTSTQSHEGCTDSAVGSRSLGCCRPSIVTCSLSNLRFLELDTLPFFVIAVCMSMGNSGDMRAPKKQLWQVDWTLFWK